MSSRSSSELSSPPESIRGSQSPGPPSLYIPSGVKLDYRSSTWLKGVAQKLRQTRGLSGTSEEGADALDATRRDHVHFEPSPPRTPIRATTGAVQSQDDDLTAGAGGPSAPPVPRNLAKILSTPGNFEGSSSHARSDGARSYVVKEMVPYVAMDISRQARIPFVDFLAHALGRCSKDSESTPLSHPELLKGCLEIVVAVCNGKGVKKAVKEYCAPSADEKARYPLFVALFNTILADLKKLQSTSKHSTKTFDELNLRGPSKLNAMFFRNDPKQISQKHNTSTASLSSYRSPDVIFAPLASAERTVEEYIKASGKDDARLFPENSPLSSFLWSDTLSTIEFKRNKAALEAPPVTYTGEISRNVDFLDDIIELDTAQGIPGEQHSNSTNLHAAQPTSTSLAKAPTHSYTLRTRPNVTIQGAAKAGAEISSTSRKRGAETQLQSQSKKAKGSHSSSAHVLHAESADQRPTPVQQNALYASEMISRGLFALHSINLLIKDDEVWLWWFDRQNVIQTSGINFVQDLPYFVALLVAFQRFDLPDWGIEPSLISKSMTNEPLGSEMDQPLQSFDLNFPMEGVTITVDPLDPIYDRLSLTGRSTRLVHATSNSRCMLGGKEVSLRDKPLAVKAYWPEESRCNEAEIIIAAREFLSVTEFGGNLPELVCWMDIDYSTDSIRKALGFLKSPGSKSRVLRLLVFVRLEAIDSLLDGQSFLKAWLGCLKCHYHLWQEGIEHGDISLWNLMWNPRESKGVLNDFDLVVFRDGHGGTYGARGGERTGTIPFMALELLCEDYYEGKIKREYRHDVESFIWVFIWVCLDGANPRQNRQLQEWKTGVFDICRKNKQDFLRTQYRCEVMPAFKACWDLGLSLGDWVETQYTKHKNNERLLYQNQPIPPEPKPEAIFKEIVALVGKYFPELVNLQASPDSSSTGEPSSVV